MRILQIKIENDEYDRLVAYAAEAGREVGDIAREVLAGWMEGREQEKRQSEWKDRMRYVKLRIGGKELQQIAEALGVSRDTVLAWEQEIRALPDVWSKAYFELKKSVDPLMWEMTYRDKFANFWGEKPSG